MSAVAVVVGTTVVMGRPTIEASVGARSRRVLELVPPQTVDDEQDDLVERPNTSSGIQPRPTSACCRSAGTMLETQAPV